MKQVEIFNVVFTHEELKTALFNYARDNLVVIPENAEFSIASPQQDEFQVTLSWSSESVSHPQDHTT
jgi:hypothetical protein